MDCDRVGAEMARALFELGERCGEAKVGRIEFKSDVGDAIYNDDTGTSQERGLGGLCEDALAAWLGEELRKRIAKLDDCPWPENIWTMTEEEYVAAVPDDLRRTRISGFLMRKGWELAREQVQADSASATGGDSADS
jgi:hypothetical protein